MRGFVRARFGAEGWQAVLDKLERADAELMDSVTSTGWYPLDAWVRIARAIDRVHGEGDLRLLTEMGHYEAERDVGPVLRALLRLANPAFTVKSVGDLWARYHDSGRWIVRDQTSHRVIMELEGWNGVDRACCTDLHGYVSRLLEIVGGKDVRIEHLECRALGRASCIWDASWR